ncbi:MAG TPA: hypothetical protein VMM17_12830 [Gemmatimonadaceae bacterium]|nr:hypothetical protein [Gemmatimonadaceae bacterium]
MTDAMRARLAPLHTRHSITFDRGSWSLTADVRWGDIDIHRARRQPELLRAVRSATRELAVRSAGTARMMVMAINDVHSCAALTLDLYDGLKHFHALRTYLDTVEFTPALSDEELAGVHNVQAEGGFQLEDCTSALTASLLTQHVASLLFRHLSTRAEEPVLAELLSFIAADEARHGQILSDLIALRIQNDPASGARALTQAERLQAAAKESGESHESGRNELALHGFMRHMETLVGRS